MNQIEFYKAKLDFQIDSWDLRELLKKEDIVIIDTRSKESYEKEHIPNAINFPHKSMDVNSTSHLDKLKLYITYCDGIGCNASTKGAFNLSHLGFKVKELIGGLDWWKKDGYETMSENS